MVCVGVMTKLRHTDLLFHLSPNATSDSPQVISVCTSFPPQKPWVSACKRKPCALFFCLKKQNKTNKQRWLSLVDRSSTAFHSWMLYGLLFLALVLWAAACLLWELALPFSGPNSSYLSRGGLCPSLSKVSSSANLQLVIQGEWSPLQFYFQFVSGRRCKEDPPTLLSSLKCPIFYS